MPRQNGKNVGQNGKNVGLLHVFNSQGQSGTGDRSVSYPFFSGYEQDEVFPQDTDLSPVPCSVKAFWYSSVLLSSVCIESGNTKVRCLSATCLAMTFSGIHLERLDTGNPIRATDLSIPFIVLSVTLNSLMQTQ